MSYPELHRSADSVGEEDKNDHSIALVGQGGGMTAAYHIGVIKALEERFPDSLSKIDRIVASSGAAAIYTYFVSGQTELQQPLFEYLYESGKFIEPLKFPPGKHIMNIDFMIDDAIKCRYPLDIESLRQNPTSFEIGVTDEATGISTYIEKNDPPELDFYELLRASCSVPYFAREAVQIGGESYLDGTIGSASGLEQVENEKNILVILTRPEKPLPKMTQARKVAAWLLMRNRPPELQQAIWNMMTQFGSIPQQVAKLSESANVAVVQPQDDLPMWRIDPRISRLRQTIKQGYADTIDHEGLTNFFEIAKESQSKS